MNFGMVDLLSLFLRGMVLMEMQQLQRYLVREMHHYAREDVLCHNFETFCSTVRYPFSFSFSFSSSFYSLT